MLSLEQIEVLKDVLVERAEEILCHMNSEGTIDRFLKIAGLSSLFEEEAKETDNQDPSGYIVVIGASMISANAIKGICKTMGISPERLKLHLDYEKAQKLNYRSMYCNSRYALILFGPIGHSARDKGDYSSIITAIEGENGYPPVIRLGTNELKVTKTGFKKALADAIERGYIIQDRESA